ncbi:MAG: hypothetical protein HYX96_02495 [Chloroflexi bacterium]|nr:hypothetical protein [Chloroflexota bacterium]
MDSSQRMQVLEEEFNIMKVEMKEALTNVRDFLLSAKIPAAIQEVEQEYDHTSLTVTKKLPSGPDEDEQESRAPKEKDLKPQANEHVEETKNVPEVPPTMAGELNGAAARANVLANLISWVSAAKKEIGQEQLPEFLDVYGSIGQLSPELRQLILRLSGVVDDEFCISSSNRSRLILELHGILSGASLPVVPLRNSNGRGQTVDKGAAPASLKLMVSDGSGNNNEFTLNLAAMSKEA